MIDLSDSVSSAFKLSSVAYDAQASETIAPGSICGQSVRAIQVGNRIQAHKHTAQVSGSGGVVLVALLTWA